MIALCTICSGLASTLAPLSKTTVVPVRLGIGVAIAGRSMPLMRPSPNNAAATAAPVLPDDTSASHSLSRSSYENDFAVIRSDSLDSSQNQFLRSIVSSHHINRNFHYFSILSLGSDTIMNLARNTSSLLLRTLTQITYLSCSRRITSALATKVAPA